MRLRFFLVSGLLLGALALLAQTAPPRRPPIIDMHLHAMPAEFWGEARHPVTGDPWAATTDEAMMRETLAALERSNIVKALASGPFELAVEWQAADPDRIIGAPMFPHWFPSPELSQLREEYTAGRLGALGELTPQFAGLSPADPELEPYWALAEELDLPVAFHTGYGLPGASYGFAPKLRARLGNPLLLEDVLVRHPKLRVYLMHAGWPFVQDTISLMYAHPQVYADVAFVWVLPRQEFHYYLQRLVQAGLADRLMFGSDQAWRPHIETAIAAVESADFLTEEQKRDIFCRNAARFLRLHPATCE